ncbi:MAG: hypothetical protein Q4A64_05620 [Porphyromonadaceae bacterium]|nr:hypothetical protein [Porphyromonadaceae bacterium]
MKQKNFSLAVAMALILSAGCTGVKNDQSGATDSLQMTAVALPELTEGDNIILENDDMRIVERDNPPTDDDVYSNSFEIQPKHTGIKHFKIKGSVLDFEKLVGRTLITSEGTGTVRTLWLHDLTTGEVVVPIDLPFDSGHDIEIADEDTFFFYTNDSDLPTICWDKQKGVWVDQNEVYDFLRNEQLKEEQDKAKQYLFDGYPLRALQMVEVKLQERIVNPLSEYKWSVVE